MLGNLFKHCSKDYRISIVDSIQLVNESHWNKLQNNGSKYLSISYLKTLEDSIPNIDFRYVLLYDNDLNPIISAYFQIVEFNDVNSSYGQWLCKQFGDQIVNKLINGMDIRLMICGNLFQCGEHGFAHDPSLTRAEAMANLQKAMSGLNKNGEKSSLMLVKEIFPANHDAMDHFIQEKYYPFSIDKNMVLELYPEWKNMDNYYASMTSKFRTKAKSIYKKSTEVTIEEWGFEQIHQNEEKIESLYVEVIKNADFNLGILNGQAFSKFKENLKEDFIFNAYLIGDKLVGFSAGFLCDNYLDAAYVGIDYEYNQQHAIYHRMMHEFVKLGIELKLKEIRFGRTAEQFKSTLGAVPIEMNLYIKHRNPVANHLLKHIVDKINPSEFEQRQPFKSNFAEEWIL